VWHMDSNHANKAVAPIGHMKPKANAIRRMRVCAADSLHIMSGESIMKNLSTPAAESYSNETQLMEENSLKLTMGMQA
jgi:hypothetical protein